MINKAFNIESILDDKQPGYVRAIVAVTGNVDSANDVILKGAFLKTIASKSPNEILCLDAHNAGSLSDVIALTTSYREVERHELPPKVQIKYPSATGGLEITNQFFMDDGKALSAYRKIKSKAVNGWSIGFNMKAKDYSYETKQIEGKSIRVRLIKNLDLIEYSPVLIPANGATATVDVKSNDIETRRLQLLREISKSRFDAMTDDEKAFHIQKLKIDRLIDMRKGK